MLERVRGRNDLERSTSYNSVFLGVFDLKVVLAKLYFLSSIRLSSGLEGMVTVKTQQGTGVTFFWSLR